MSRLAPGLNPRAPVAQLDRSFQIIVFDWDGTAVTDRAEDASALRTRLVPLLEAGVFVVVITGTNFPNIDRQLSRHMTGPYKRRLFVCTNRGSEVFGFDARSQPVRLWQRVASPRENNLLSEIAASVQRLVSQRTGLQTRVIYNRLNRRKIDLIPIAEWAHPAKSDLGPLLEAVQNRLRQAGLAGGLGEVFDWTRRIAAEKGLTDARMTSDVKHVEVGLTDKGDAIDWLMREVAAPNDIPPRDVLVVGDEFGPIAGFTGSDARMLRPSDEGATFVSVGPEPNGVPPEVIRLGGGPATFRALLDHQTALHPDPKSEDSPSGWEIVEAELTPAREHEIESLFTVANGYLGTRGTLHEHLPLAQPATFIAGIFKREPEEIPELVVAPDWADFRVYVDGGELQAGADVTLHHWRRLDLRRGAFEHVWRCNDASGRVTRLHFRRFVSLADRHTLVESITLVPENYSARLRVESLVDGQIATGRVQVLPPADLHLARVDTGLASGRAACLTLVTPNPVGPTEVAFATGTILWSDQTVEASSALLSGERWVGERWDWFGNLGVAYRVSKFVSVFSSRETPDPPVATIEHLADVLARGEDRLFDAHAAAWATRWQTADVTIVGNDAIQEAIRFATYHLISASNPDDERISVGARALTGNSYKGHVFWETEIYLVPFFTFTNPPSARALLMYRFHTLPSAQRKARSLGYRGALYPWESTDTGEEAAPPYAIYPDGQVLPIETGQQEHHISADVAYAVWQYWQATGDDRFFLEAGAEVLIETARFWASRVTLGSDGLYHIERVIGPDEYHGTVDDDAYTNAMAQWNLRRASEVIGVLRRDWPERWGALDERLKVSEGESAEWVAIAEKIYQPFDPTTGLIEQFRGYFTLEDIDVAAYVPRTGPIDLLLGPERVARSQIIKQPDVVMLIYLLWDQFPPWVRAANFRYYAPRCAQGSSLSPSIHALIAARLGDHELAQRYLEQAATIDLANNLGNAAGGVHIGAMAGLWQAIVFGYAGIHFRQSEIAVEPAGATPWDRLRFPLLWRGRQLKFDFETASRSVNLAVERGDAIPVSVGESNAVRAVVTPGHPFRAEHRDGTWQSPPEVTR